MALNLWNGTSWIPGSGVRVWNGTDWLAACVKIWNGSAWIDILSNVTVIAGTFSGVGVSAPGEIAEVSYLLDTDGITYVDDDPFGGGTDRGNWLVSPNTCGFASDYEVKATLLGGITPSGTLGSWLDFPASWGLSINFGDSPQTSTIFVEIRRKATGTVLSTGTVTLNVSF